MLLGLCAVWPCLLGDAVDVMWMLGKLSCWPTAACLTWVAYLENNGDPPKPGGLRATHTLHRPYLPNSLSNSNSGMPGGRLPTYSFAITCHRLQNRATESCARVLIEQQASSMITDISCKPLQGSNLQHANHRPRTHALLQRCSMSWQHDIALGSYQ